MSPAIKTSLGYNQRQIGLLGVAKNLGDAIGFVSGALSDVSPSWAVLLVGAAQNFVGYGFVWLVVTGQLPSLPLWMVRRVFQILFFVYMISFYYMIYNLQSEHDSCFFFLCFLT